jgi:hypothetical protein
MAGESNCLSTTSSFLAVAQQSHVRMAHRVARCVFSGILFRILSASTSFDMKLNCLLFPPLSMIATSYVMRQIGNNN